MSLKFVLIFMVCIHISNGALSDLEVDAKNHCEKYRSIYASLNLLQGPINFIIQTNENRNLPDCCFKNILLEFSSSYRIGYTAMSKSNNVIACKSMEEIIKTLNSYNFTRKYFLALIALNITSNDLQQFEIFRKIKWKNVVLLFEQQGIIKSVTSKPRFKKLCHEPENDFKLRNFSKDIYDGENKWNFQGCQVRVTVYISPPIITCNKVNCEETLDGRDVEMIKTLAKALNFTIKFKVFQFNNFENTFLTIQNNTSDVMIGDYFLRHDRAAYMDASDVYCRSEMIFIIPKGRPYTSLECLVKPFGLLIWILVISIVCFVFGVVVIVRKIEKGEGFDSKKYNFSLTAFISVLLGQSLYKFSMKNYNRIWLLNLVLFSFVMRTVYHGSMYGFLQSDMTKRAIESLDEMVERKFKFYIFGWNANFLDNIGIKRNDIVSVNENQIDSIMENLKNPDFKSTFVRAQVYVSYINYFQIYNYTYETHQQSLMNAMVVLYFQKSSFFTKPFSMKIRQLTEAGIINLWHQKYLRKHKKTLACGPKVLTMKHFSGIFTIWLCLNFAAVLVFIFEHIVGYCQIKKKNVLCLKKRVKMSS